MSHHAVREHRINRNYRIRVIGLAGGVDDPTAPDISGCYLLAYDAQAYDGRGFAEFTNDPSRARLFPTLADAIAYYNQASGYRPDGKKNRPLTALTVTFEPA